MPDPDRPLPAHSIACALGLVDAVRCHSKTRVARALEQAAAGDGLEALAVTLAAFVDEDKPLTDLLAWVDGRDRSEVRAWRNSLTDNECRDFRNAYNTGERSPDVVDGNREYYKRQSRRQRNRQLAAVKAVA